MAISIDYHSHNSINASSRQYTDFVTFEVNSDAGHFTLYLHSVEDAKALFSAATEAVTNMIHLEAEAEIEIGA